MIGDERAADRFTLDAGDVERLFYGCSVLHCLPVGMVGEDRRAPGRSCARHRPPLRERGRLRGFEVLPIENDFWRFYRLVP